MQRYMPTAVQRITNWLCSMMFLMVSLLFPFLIAITYHESIPQKTMHIAIGMYLLTVATTARNLAIFFFLLLFAIYMFSSYGAYKNSDYFVFSRDIYSGPGLIILLSSLVAAVEKWHQHVEKGDPFLPFSENSNKL